MIDPASQAVSVLQGVGPQIANKLARLHVNTVQDVLFHLPSRYEDRTRITELNLLRPGMTVMVVGQIDTSQVLYRNRRSLMVHITDGAGSVTIRLFYFSRSQEKSFKNGLWVRCYGEVRFGVKGYEMIHPEYQIFPDKPVGGLDKTLTAVYPSTEGVSQKLWRKIIDQVLSGALPKVTELLPESLCQQLGYNSVQEALQMLHRPPASMSLSAMEEATSASHQRLIFEELLAHHLSLRKARLARIEEQAAQLLIEPALRQQFAKQLGFEFTAAQNRVNKEISEDLKRCTPMMRLLQGDVGSGKTVVAALAMLHAVSQDVQTVLMAPTELLAEQHFNTIKSWFEPLDVGVGWLASKTPAKQKKQVLEQLASGQLLVAVGTHALIQAAVSYQKLGLVVIDEQHRFGVDQRLALRKKTSEKQVPHQLVMTATPIPRTLAMSFYADLDVSSIDELPPGRQPVNTVVMSGDDKRDEVIQRVNVACNRGRQVYWVCPLIDESEVLTAQAATETETELIQKLPNLRVGLIHGRMKSKDKEAIMQAFRQDEVDVLVATTVIEVGVDVPNASLMVIENSERMGLAQLHQLRGRVGRGDQQSYCILLYQKPLGQVARQRLKTLRETNDGFEIAEKDLQLRGAGELLGTRQTGSLSFKVVDLVRDQHLLPQVAHSAKRLAAESPESIEPLIQRWVGSKQNYANA